MHGTSGIRSWYSGEEGNTQASNSETILKQFTNYVGGCSHDHAHPYETILEKLKVYSWKLYGIVVKCIEHMKEEQVT